MPDIENNAGETKRVLIVGDWVVDDYWITGIHRLPTARRAGRAHFRALHSIASTVRSFGATGRVASILHAAKAGRRKFVTTIGLGVWHIDDTETLRAMVRQDGSKSQTPHRVVSKYDRRGDDPLMLNLADALRLEDENSCGTTRVIRVYQQIGSRVDLLQRIDWEVRRERDWVTDSELLSQSDLDEKLRQVGNIDAVVVVDFSKGVISKQLMSWLVQKFENIPWFVSTLDWQPDNWEWLTELENVDVRLLLISQVAAQRAIHEGSLSRWITQSGYASKGALDQIDGFSGLFRDNSKSMVVVLPEGSTIVARDRDRPGDRRGVVQAESDRSPLDISMPFATVLFPSLVANIIENNDIELETLLRYSLDFTNKWRSFESKRVMNPETWQPDGGPRLNLDSQGSARNVGKWQTFIWRKAKRRWQEAFSGWGVIRHDDRKYFDVWRSMSQVDGYVCCVKSKRKVLQRLVRELVAAKQGWIVRRQLGWDNEAPDLRET